MFYIIEIQKNAQGQYAHIVETAETQRAAESTYYSKLSYAAQSNLPLHSVAIITEDGDHHMSKSYRNGESHD